MGLQGAGMEAAGREAANPMATMLAPGCDNLCPMAEPLTCQRALFAIPDHVAYLNCAYMGPLPRATAEVGRRALEAKLQPWRIGTDDFFEPVDAVRNEVATLLAVEPDTIAITPSVSYGVAVAAANLPVEPGQRIVTLADQFPSNVYPWRALADRAGGSMDVVARPRDHDWTSAVVERLDDDVAVVSLPPCHWTDGTRVDLAAVGVAARAVGAALVVDSCQAAGAAPIDVAAIEPDFVLGAFYKWLLGPYSLAWAYVDPSRHDGVPLENNWIARAGSRDFAGLVDYRDDYQPGARRYDMGEVSNFALVPPATASMRLVNDLGPARVAAYARTITDRIAEGAADLGLAVAPPAARSDHLVGLRLPAGTDPATVAAALAAADVHVSVRGDSVRVSAHVFNAHDDADRLLDALRSAVG